jgi:soluble lytic murein transglycosylase-like protein
MTIAGIIAMMLTASPRAPIARVRVLAPIILTEATRIGVPADLAIMVAAHESAYRQDVVGKRGELGVMQVAPSGRAIEYCRAERGGLRNLRLNVRCGMRLLKRALDVCEGVELHALTQYNGGRCRPSPYARRVLAHRRSNT